MILNQMTFRSFSVNRLSITMTNIMDTGWAYVKLITDGCGLTDVMTLLGKKF